MNTEGERDARGSATLAAVAVGVVTFLVVAVAVTALLEDVVWPSLFVGLPAGVLAGAIAGVATAYLLRE
ncbi:MAG: hypothetical protein ABEJ90_04910 [Halobacterium sp.]